LEIKNKLSIFVLCLLCILFILFWGLRPFNFNPSNGATWLKVKAGNGIYFHNHGIVYGPSEFKDFDQPPLFGKNESFSIELWLTPGSVGSNRFSCIFGLYNEHLSEIFSLSQVKSSLNLSKYQNPKNKSSNHNWRWLKEVFLKGQRRLLTITSDKTGTTVYINGKKARKYRNYSLMSARQFTPTERIVIGDDPSGRQPWAGEIYGLAIYNLALSPGQVFEHFEKWRNESALSLLKEKDIIALYPMDEQNGQIIHNAVFNHYHLSIPARFKILKKNFLNLSGNALKLNGSSLRDMRLNILGFIPLGYLLIVTIYSTKSSRASSWRLIFLVVLGGTVVSLVIEILQAHLPTRNSSLTDLIFNSFGTGLGVILAFVFLKIINPANKT